MNVIDKKFNILVATIKNQSLEEVYHSIKEKYKNILPSIQMSLEDYFVKFPYWGTLKKEEENFEELYNRAKSLKEHIDDYIWLYEKLEDYRSKKVLYAILSNWYQFDFETLNTSIEKNYPHYFDLDIVKCSKDEVFVDLGAYTGDTILDFLYHYGTDQYKKIYAYEITEDSFQALIANTNHYANIECQNKAVSNQKGTLYVGKSDIDYSANTIRDEGEIEVESVLIDEEIKEPITMIKMDIEGSEQKALLGCKRHIKEDTPKLLMSVYHNHEDLYKIPRMIDEMNPNYHYYLRYYGNNIFPTEIVLIAIPKK